MSHPERRYVSLQDAAKYVSADEKTLRRQIARGRLTGYRIGRRIRIDLTELDRLMSPASGADQ